MEIKSNAELIDYRQAVDFINKAIEASDYKQLEDYINEHFVRTNLRIKLLKLMDDKCFDDDSLDFIVRVISKINNKFDDSGYMKSFTIPLIRFYYDSGSETIKFFLQDKFFNNCVLEERTDSFGNIYYERRCFTYEVTDLEKEKPSKDRLNLFRKKRRKFEIPYFILKGEELKRDYLNISDKVEVLKEEGSLVEVKVLENIEYYEVGNKKCYHKGDMLRTYKEFLNEDIYTISRVFEGKYFQELYGKPFEYYSIINDYLNRLSRSNPLLTKTDTALQIDKDIDKSAINCFLNHPNKNQYSSIDEMKEYLEKTTLGLVNYLQELGRWDNRSSIIKRVIENEISKLQQNFRTKEKEKNFNVRLLMNKNG